MANFLKSLAKKEKKKEPGLQYRRLLYKHL